MFLTVGVAYWLIDLLFFAYCFYIQYQLYNGYNISHYWDISHIMVTSYWDQVNSWKNLWKFWNGSLCRNKSSPFSLLNVAAYWQSSNAEACAKKFSQILANNFNNGGGGLVSEFMWGIVAKGTAIKIRAYLSTILVIIFWNFSIFYPSSDLP